MLWATSLPNAVGPTCLCNAVCCRLLYFQVGNKMTTSGLNLATSGPLLKGLANGKSRSRVYHVWLARAGHRVQVPRG